MYFRITEYLEEEEAKKIASKNPNWVVAKLPKGFCVASVHKSIADVTIGEMNGALLRWENLAMRVIK